MAKSGKIKYKPGDIVTIPLPEARFAYARIFEDHTFGIFAHWSAKPEPLAQVATHPIAFFVSGTDSAIKDGTWLVVGHVPFQDAEASFPPPVAICYDYDSNTWTMGRPMVTHKGTEKFVTAKEVAGLDRLLFCHKPALVAATIVDRLIDGNHAYYKVRPSGSSSSAAAAPALAPQVMQVAPNPSTTGPWGARAQENDDASDWLAGLEEEPGLGLGRIDEAFDQVLSAEPSAYLEVTECAEVVAAATVLAKMHGLAFAADIASDECMAALAKRAKRRSPKSTAALVQRALLALAAVQDPERSELRGLMVTQEHADLGAAWSKRMGQLVRGLKAAHRRLASA
ncbi:hypothetical protein HNP48_004812 [Acidovorax soli]|uniref:Uncharacterized protein n=1 Tax=Acidovorax soli TaxID=592050 RepID=A0A7X0PHM6_9BURK|nr:DUF4259 domain-containing protein [Acidovorax soli]MBB6562103.1 hypothetical protein [Acidovorax soli]